MEINISAISSPKKYGLLTLLLSGISAILKSTLALV